MTGVSHIIGETRLFVSNKEIPIFPLPLVLFPGGPLPLRIFETRYVDMVSRCARDDAAFGVALLVSEGEEGVARLAEMGTSARIVDWNQGSDGLLYITGRGERRFQLESVRQQDDGLNLAEVTWLVDEVPDVGEQELSPMATVLRSLLESNEMLYGDVSRHYDDASWVSFRLAEILPLTLDTRQRCLELRSAEARLALLKPVISQLTIKSKQPPEQ